MTRCDNILTGNSHAGAAQRLFGIAKLGILEALGGAVDFALAVGCQIFGPLTEDDLRAHR